MNPIEGGVVMMPNGLAGSWLVRAVGPEGELLRIETGLTEAATRELGERWAVELGIPFRRVSSWRELEPDDGDPPRGRRKA